MDMSRRPLRSLAGALGLLLAAAPIPLAAQTGLTIYNDGRVLVRRTLAEALAAGVTSHRLSLGLLDPNSVFALDSGVAIVGSSYDASVDEENTMRRAVGTTLKFLTGGTTNGVPDTTSALVIGVSPERFRRADGRVSFQRPGLPLYPAELVLGDPTLARAVRTASSQPSLRIGYFTQGAAWNASYTVVLGKNGSRVSGLASIASGSLRVNDADIQLLAGSVGRAGQSRFDMASAKAMDAREGNGVAQGFADEQQIGEAHLYTIPGKISLEPGVTTGVALFEPAAAPWERSYVVRGQIPYYGMLQQVGNDENVVPVEVWYTLKRTPKTPFGDLPLPMGTYRLYQGDDANRLQLIGESSAGHTAPGRDVRLSAGSAFDLTAKRIQTTYSTRRDSTRTIAKAEFKVTITSAKDSATTVEVLEDRAGEWSVLSSSLPAEKVSSTRTRFRVRVPGKGEAVLTYRVRVVW
jgi:hypothetical protein